MSLNSRTLFYLTQSRCDEQFIRSSIAELREIIKEHNEKYYQTADPVISDNEYDQLFSLLKERENRFPELIVSDSPTQRLVGQKIDSFASSRHLAEMSSLQNTYSAEDIEKRDGGLKRIQKQQDEPLWTYIIEPKLDGMSVELVYEYGLFVRAVTRGDGWTGEDITEHAKQLIGLPHTISALQSIPVLALRGEIVMDKNAFDRLSGVLTTSGGVFANARNATAGTLRQLDTSLVQKRGLSVFVYDILFVEGELGCSSAHEQFALFRAWGVPFFDWIHYFTTIDEVIQWCNAPSTKHGAENQQINLDGLVIKIQEFSYRTFFGATNHHPKWAIAYKFPAQQVVTQLEEVSFQVGRTGILTPVAHLTPVQVSGVTISRASLHNRSFIKERGLYQGDRVLIQRSGEVIPYIVAGLPERRVGSEQPIPQPMTCPVCSHTIYVDDRAGTFWCGNASCDAQIKQRLEHAVSKTCLDISGFGPSLIEHCVDAGLLHTLADLFVLLSSQKKQLLRALPGIAEKKIALIEKEITQKSPYPLRRIINAIGIRHIGEVSSRDLASHFLACSEKKTASMEGFISYCGQTNLLEQIYGFGKEMVISLQLFLSDEANLTIIRRIDAYGVIDWGRAEKKHVSSSLQNIHVVITGSFVWTREEIEDILRDHGAILQAVVTQKTDVLLAGTGGGSKRLVAEKLGVPIMDIHTFCQNFSLTDLVFPQSNATVSIQQTSLF